ncbi:lytic transglycosylase domain-containing protein [Devosia ginsengisoli]|uniref:Lytic transglycosylase domain-containing protein n=1 Tax=Devosia ginsengisoli TaxID=400770 RepID=A0A5B8LQD2_9HYPH|nr:lytic transglycosylase domain-containing protein [Devosia ginsengisoli]QDZ09925.1 lytic transglycosylase domain-containing protein [Devosia ginsengisoli]
MMRQFRAGLIAAVLGLLSFAPISHATANDTIDPITTGTVQANAGAPAADARGSAAFRAALDELLDGDPVAAYTKARALPDAMERRTIQWAAIYFNAGKIDYQSVQRFAADAPDFATQGIYRTRIEQSLAKAETDPNAVVAALGGTMPNTIDGQIMLAKAYLAQGETSRATSIAKSIWIDNFLTEEQETEVLDTLGSLLDRDTHWARAMHLMMHDRARGSERLLPYLSDAQKSLVVARAAVSRNDADAKARLDSVDPSMQSNPVFIFSRAQRARQFELWESAVDWLAKAPDVVPDAAEWWYERRTLLRKLLDVGEPQLAYRAAADYDKGPEGRLVEARFHAGWIALSFLDDAASAKTHFTAMAGLSTLPDSVTQANYWLARANLKLGDTAAAQAAFEAAARYGNVYYGQLARTELGQAGVDLRPLPDWRQSEALFDSNPIVRAVRLLAANGQANMAVPLLRNFGNGLTGGAEMLLAARLAQEIGAHHVAIAIANTADQRGTPLDLFSFPEDGLPTNAQLAADRAAVYAIARQESMFQIDAVSSAGARGLMQLMPGTAQDVARKVGVDYSASRLVSDAAYNALLGSTYLGAQLDRYDGSLVLAAAAYNAGPGNANKWIKAYGDPRADNVDPVIWVELIPFQETRTYVKRVLGNYLVYRQRLGDSPVTLQQALRSIR